MTESTGIDKLLCPQTLVVLGASRDPTKWGHRAIVNCLEAGFGGRIYAVNPKAGVSDIAGAPVIPTVTAIAEPVDCAFIAVPAAHVEQAVTDCATAGVSAAFIAASGFAEAGAQGRAAQSRIAAIAREASLRLLGPNGIGVYRNDSGLVLCPTNHFDPGRIAFITQSGNISVALSQLVHKVKLGFSTVIGIGNQIDIGFGELLEWFSVDDETSVIGLYLEGLNPGTGEAFMQGLDSCTRANKPVVVLKSGRSAAGKAVVATHTAAIASDDRVWDSVLQAHHTVRVDSVQALFDALAGACTTPPLRSRSVAVVTDGGGDTAVAADAVGRAGMEFATLGPDTKQKLEQLIPADAPRAPGLNPITIDTPGGMDDDPLLVAAVVDTLSRDPAVEAVIVGGVFGGYRVNLEMHLEAARRLIELATKVPLVVQTAFADSDPEAIRRLRSGGVLVLPEIARALAALDIRMPRRSRRRPPPAGAGASRSAGRLLPPTEGAFLLAGAGIPVPPMQLVVDEDALENVLAVEPFPVCVKLADPRVAHKSDMHAIHVNLTERREAVAAAAALWQRFPGSPVLVMPSFPPGVEVLVGAFVDPLFGAVAIIGRGGIWTEVEHDALLEIQPSSPECVRQHMEEELKMWPMLEGSRGQPGVDIEALCHLVCDLATVAASNPRLSIEVNPVICYQDSFALADIRVVER